MTEEPREEDLRGFIIDTLQRSELNTTAWINELRQPTPPGEAHPTVYYQLIGAYWRIHRERAGLSRDYVAGKMQVGDLFLASFENGMMIREDAQTLPEMYAGAIGRPELHLSYLQLLRSLNVPEDIYKRQ